MAIARNHQAEYTHWKSEETKLIQGVPVRFRDVCVHTIKMSDVEDPDLYVADPILKWQNSESGQWVMENAVEQPYWTRQMDTWNYGYQYKIMARLSEQNITYFNLKFVVNQTPQG